MTNSRTSMQSVLSVSGGKDSTAMLLLAIEERGMPPDFRAVFADTGNEHPITYDYVRYLSDETGINIEWVKQDFSAEMQRKARFIDSTWRSQGIDDDICDRAIKLLSEPSGIPFLDMCLWKGLFPSVKARFCTQSLKIKPMYEQVCRPLLDAGFNIECWQGVRADESSSRALLPERDLVSRGANGAEHWNYRPILEWKVEDVFAMHRKHSIEPNPLYKLGMGRVGCMPCIMTRKDELLQISQRFPDQIERIREWEIIVSQASKRGGSTFFSLADNRGDGVWQCVEWSKTSRGGKQYDFLRATQADNECSSIYGLCE